MHALCTIKVTISHQTKHTPALTFFKGPAYRILFLEPNAIIDPAKSLSR